MPFLTIEDVKTKDNLIKEYLKNRGILRDRFRQQKMGEVVFQEQNEKTFKPITEKLEEVQKKTDDQMIQRIQDEVAPLLAIEQKPNKIYNIEFEKDFDDEERNLLADQGFDVNLNDFPNNKDSKEISLIIAAAKQKNKELGGKMRGTYADKKHLRKFTKVNKKYYRKLTDMLNALSMVNTGSGIKAMLGKDPNVMCKRLYLLSGEKKAGNNNPKLSREIKKIATQLHTNGHIDSKILSHLINDNSVF